MTNGPLSSTPTYVHGFTRSDGTVVKPHLAKRRRKIETTKDPRQATITGGSGSPLNEFLAKHGGTAHVRASLEKMTPEHRAKLIDAMAALGGVEPAAVIEKLGMQADPVEADVGAKKHEIVEHVTRKGRTLRGVIRRDLSLEEAKKIDEYTFRKDGGFFIRERHLAAAEALDAAREKGTLGEDEHAAARQAAATGGPEAASDALMQGREKTEKAPAEPVQDEPATVAPDDPKEGDTKFEDGVEYVLRDGRWHRASPEEEPAAETTAEPEPATAEPAQEPEVVPEAAEASDEKPAASEERKPRERSAAADAEDGDLDPSSPNYRYRDTGYIAGSRKEMAAQMIRKASRNGEHVRATDIDWEEIEKNPREAKELITKANLFGTVDWEAMRDAGVDPGAAFLVGKIYAAIPTGPASDTEQVRRDYAVALDTLRDRLGACKTPQAVVDALEEIKGERNGAMLNEKEQGLYERAREFYREELKRVEDLDEKYGALQRAATEASIRRSKLKYEILKRKSRNWSVDPEVEKQLDVLELEARQADDAAITFHQENGMERIPHKIVREDGVWTRYQAQYRERLDKAAEALAIIKDAAHARNVAENPLTRAWLALGDDFSGVLDYRSHRGSKAFANHVATVKAGKVKDWSWAEKKTEPRKSTQQSVTFQLQVADTFEREGGRAVSVDSTQSLKKAFNLREVQSGNWVLDDPNSAKFHVEACAGGFADLADLLGIADENVSFNGRLAMAFGARGKGGKGAAKAHYEPIQRTINLTKLAGGGSLAHEWFHCVDNLIKEATTGIASGSDDFATLSPGTLGTSELKSAFSELVTAMMDGPHRHVETLTYTEAEERWAKSNMSYSYGMIRGDIQSAKTAQEAVDAVEAAYAKGQFGNPEKKKSKNTRDSWRKIALIHHAGNAERKIEYATGRGMSSYQLEARELDKGVPGKYWSAPHEMAARAFSAFIEDKLATAGKKNTYLVSMANNEVYRRLGEPFRPFPEGEERARVNAAMEKLFAIVARDNVLAKASSLDVFG